ncbi:MAG: flagellar biosynthesis protein FlhB [Candidatus Adiutricales bacterium]
MPEDKSRKTEKPSAKKRQEARKKGQVPKSIEVNSVAVLMAGLFVLYFTSGHIYQELSGIMADSFSEAGQIAMGNPDFHKLLVGKGRQVATILAPVMLAVFCAALLANFFQVGLLFSSDSITPKLSRLSPLKGFSRIFSLQSLMTLFKSLSKMIIIASTAFFIVKSESDTVMGLGQLNPEQIGLFALGIAFKIFLLTSWIMVVLAIIDFAFQKWQSERDLRMSREEVKEETKQTEGDPHVRARIRAIQRDLARRRMMSAVPEADVVVTNPIHLAVALKYDISETDAPLVTAKGQGLIAERIKKLAGENDIPIIEDKPLAQGLYRSVEVGEVIPIEFYQAVADVLAYVYQVKGTVING